MSDYEEALFAAKSWFTRELELLGQELIAKGWPQVGGVIEDRAFALRRHLCTLADRDAAEKKRAAEANGEYVGRDRRD